MASRESLVFHDTMAKVATKAKVVTAAERRTAISVIRGVQLAVHAAAGIVQNLDLEAVRLLRVCEGLARAAAGRVETLGRASAAPPEDCGVAGGGKAKDGNVNKNELTKEEKKGKRKTRRKQSKGMDVCADADEAAAAADSCLEPEIDDEWADSPARAISPTVVGSAPRPAVPPGRSGSRSPRGRSSSVSADVAPLCVGNVASIVALDSRPELAGAYVELLEFDKKVGRWICKTTSGERLRIVPGKLKGIPWASASATRRRFNAEEKAPG